MRIASIVALSSLALLLACSREPSIQEQAQAAINDNLRYQRNIVRVPLGLVRIMQPGGVWHRPGGERNGEYYTISQAELPLQLAEEAGLVAIQRGIWGLRFMGEIDKVNIQATEKGLRRQSQLGHARRNPAFLYFSTMMHTVEEIVDTTTLSGGSDPTIQVRGRLAVEPLDNCRESPSCAREAAARNHGTFRAVLKRNAFTRAWDVESLEIGTPGGRF